MASGSAVQFPNGLFSDCCCLSFSSRMYRYLRSGLRIQVRIKFWKLIRIRIRIKEKNGSGATLKPNSGAIEAQIGAVKGQNGALEGL